MQIHLFLEDAIKSTQLIRIKTISILTQSFKIPNHFKTIEHSLVTFICVCAWARGPLSSTQLLSSSLNADECERGDYFEIYSEKNECSDSEEINLLLFM